jgi:hypothetical protein
MSLVVDRSVEAVHVDHFEQLVVVAIVDVHADEYWTIAVIQGSLQDRRDFLGGSDHHSLGTECLGVLDDIHRAKIDARRPAVLLNLLYAYHVVRAVDPNHVDNVLFQADSGFPRACGHA